MGNKTFWNTVKLFLTSKSFLHNEDIALHIGDKTVTDCNELAKEFNEYYINIVQNTTGKATIKLQGSNNDKSTVETIIKTYEHHPSIKFIKEHIQKESNGFNIKAASVGQINKMIEGSKPKKATGPDKCYIRQTKTEIKKRNRTIRTSLALSLTNYYLKFVRLITHLFPMLHFDATQ